MPRGGCLSCMRGTLIETLLQLIAVLGMGLILLGLIMYNKDILDIKMDAISKDDMNNYVGYATIFLGTLLILISALTWIRT